MYLPWQLIASARRGRDEEGRGGVGGTRIGEQVRATGVSSKDGAPLRNAPIRRDAVPVLKISKLILAHRVRHRELDALATEVNVVPREALFNRWAVRVLPLAPHVPSRDCRLPHSRVAEDCEPDALHMDPWQRERYRDSF